MAENTVFLLLTALIHNFYKTIMSRLDTKAFGLKKTSRIKGLKRYPYIVAEQEGHIIGYAYVSIFHERKAYDWAVETSIYVDKDYKRSGCGKLLYQALEKILKKQHISNLYACIAYTEQEDEHLTNDSMHFHEHLGYELVGTFKQCGYKFNKWYDMIWMEKMIGEHPENPEAFIPFSEMDVREIFELI